MQLLKYIGIGQSAPIKLSEKWTEWQIDKRTDEGKVVETNVFIYKLYNVRRLCLYLRYGNENQLKVSVRSVLCII